MRRLLTSKFRNSSLLAVALPLLVCGAGRGAEADPALLADKAIAAKYDALGFAYEQQMAQGAVGSSKNRIEKSKEELQRAENAVEQATQKLQAASAELAQQEAAAKMASERAEASDDADDQAAADKVEKERQEAELAVRQAEGALKRESDVRERRLQSLQKYENELAAALETIPEKEAAAKVAKKEAEAIRAQAQQARARHAATQDAQAVARQVDEFIDAQLKSAGLTASPAADDAEFLRRVTLDITGAVPMYEEVVEFLDDPSPDKRSLLVDRLLADEAYGRNFAQRFCTPTTETSTSTLVQEQEFFKQWLAESLQLNRRWDRVATDMLASEGYGYRTPGVLFTVAYRMNQQPDPGLLVAAAGDHFLGLQIKCAQCHDHPYHEWKQEEFWELAAMFGRVRLAGRTSRELEHQLTDDDVKPEWLVRMGGVKYPDQLTGGRIAIPDPVDVSKTLGTVSAAFLDGTSPELPEKGNYRRVFAQWVTSKENPYFARATVNRLWAHFFGRGIVEPIDNLHPDNAPTHPEVLERLAEEFKRCEYDVQHLIRCIVCTQAYGRTSRQVDGNEGDEVLLSHMAVKPLESYALVDSLAVVLRRASSDASQRRDAAALFDTRLPGGDPTKYTHSTPQVLKLMNSKEHVATNSAAVQAVTRDKSPEEAIAHLYLAVLARRPSDAERGEMLAYTEQLGDERQAYADIFWVLLNSAEFLMNH